MYEAERANEQSQTVNANEVKLDSKSCSTKATAQVGAGKKSVYICTIVKNTSVFL